MNESRWNLQLKHIDFFGRIRSHHMAAQSAAGLIDSYAGGPWRAVWFVAKRAFGHLGIRIYHFLWRCGLWPDGKRDEEGFNDRMEI